MLLDEQIRWQKASSEVRLKAHAVIHVFWCMCDIVPNQGMCRSYRSNVIIALGIGQIIVELWRGGVHVPAAGQ